MRYLLMGMALVSLLAASCGQTTGYNDGASKSVSTNTVNTHSFKLPSDTDVKRMTATTSILPGSQRRTFTNPDSKATIDQILIWLKKSTEVGVEKPAIGKGDYPPELEIVLNNGITIAIGPAQNWSSRKLANGSTEISGKNVVGYVALATMDGHSSKVVRLYSPELYRWIVNHEWE